MAFDTESQRLLPSVSPNTSINYNGTNNNDTNTTHYISIPIPESNTNRNYIKRKKSILDMPFGSFKGANSLTNFKFSLNRANSFKEFTTINNNQKENFIFNNDRKMSIISNRSSILNLRDSILTPRPNTTEQIIIQRVEQKDGSVVNIVTGNSTAPQTIFNSINVLIGIGLFALPLGLMHAGWILGLTLLSIFAFATFCTSELLSRCLDTDPTLLSYADLSYKVFGSKGKFIISLIFSLDLFTCGVSLIILFGDSLNSLIPSYSINFFKVLSFFIITPGCFMPLSILSNISLLGILSTISTVILIFISGLLKNEQPGSLINPMPTNLWPKNFQSFCLSIGLLSASWGGHAVFPNLKSDMRHPHKFHDCLKKTYYITALTDFSTAIMGFLMFGITCHGEITQNVMNIKGYPSIIYLSISISMALIPIAKTPLNARPIISVLDSMLPTTLRSSFITNFLKIFNKFFINILFVYIAVVFPQFDRLIAFLGAGLVFTICLILPCAFYLSICRATIKPWEQLACYFTISISIMCGVLGVSAAIRAD